MILPEDKLTPGHHRAITFLNDQYGVSRWDAEPDDLGRIRIEVEEGPFETATATADGAWTWNR